MFIFFINDILTTMEDRYPTTHRQAFVDYLFLNTHSTLTLQIAVSTLVTELETNDLQLNPGKCEVLTDDLGDSITIGDQLLQTKTETKYIGQLIDNKAQPKVYLKESAFGPFYDLLRSFGDVSKLTRIRLFNVYSKSMISHHLVVVCLGEPEHIRDTWKLIRKVIFRTVLQKDTSPKECMAFYKLGFYEVLIRPLIKFSTLPFFASKQQEYEELRTSISKCLQLWISEEENLSQPVLSHISSLIDNPASKIDPNHFDFLRINDSWKRLSTSIKFDCKTKWPTSTTQIRIIKTSIEFIYFNLRSFDLYMYC